MRRRLSRPSRVLPMQTRKQRLAYVGLAGGGMALFILAACGFPSPRLEDSLAEDGGDAGARVDTGDAEEVRPVIMDSVPYDAGDAGYIDISGSWSGTWTAFPGGGKSTMELTQDGGNLSGTGNTDGLSLCAKQSTIVGWFVEPYKVELTSTSDDGTTILTMRPATISPDGNNLSGEFRSEGSCLKSWTGTTSLDRQ